MPSIIDRADPVLVLAGLCPPGKRKVGFTTSSSNFFVTSGRLGADLWARKCCSDLAAAALRGETGTCSPIASYTPDYSVPVDANGHFINGSQTLARVCEE